MIYKVGTRGSKLAISQTKQVIEKLKNHFPKDLYEIVVIETIGDKEQTKALDTIGQKGIFTYEIESALLSNDIDFAVHSMKDMPAEIKNGLTFAKAWKREDPRDVLILREASSFDRLPKGDIIATGSKRRAFQLKNLRDDIEIVGIRGNVDTRIRKLYEPLEDGRNIDGIVLAAAGLIRLGRESEITEYLSIEDMIPAPCQGTVALELREDNIDLLNKLNSLSDDDAIRATKAERDFLKSVGGNCHLPIGAYLDTDSNLFYTIFGNEDGSRLDIKKRKYES